MIYPEIDQGVLAEFIVNILRVSMIKQAAELFLTRREQRKRVFQAVLAVYYLASSAAYCLWRISAAYELLNLAGILVLAGFYEDGWKKKIWAASVLFCLDMCCLFTAFFIFGEDALYGFYMGTAAGVLLFLACVFILQHILDVEELKEAELGGKQALALTAVPAAGVVLLSAVMGMEKAQDMLAGLICVCVLIVNLSVLYLYHGLLKSARHLRERDSYRQQTRLYQNQLEVIMESQGRIRALRHDMKNHLLALQAIAGRGDSGELQEYLHGMRDFMVNPSEYVMTGNEQVDSLLNYKIGKAAERLSSVKTDIRIPEELHLNSFDLNVILGNLLDNAVESAIQTEEKKLEIRMRAEKGLLFLNIRNSCPEKQAEKKGSSRAFAAFPTTKADRENHGIGLKNVQAIVEKYHGDMELTCENGWFEADLMLYLKEL